MDEESADSAAEDRPEFTPSSYMRTRRPHLFSDSSGKTEYSLTKEVLSHHLETLTNLKDETKFEEFARRLAERFISPNLRPQTGPTGGGDGKTDSETYPVSSELALRWFVPENTGAHEPWAFAFSAKKDWRGKVRSDVKEIVGTNRCYTRIYFVSNQFIPAKSCVEVQDALAGDFGVPVTILDRTWILDKILNHHSVDLAVETLGLTSVTSTKSKVTGSQDFKREAKLEKLEKSIADGANYQGAPLPLAEDCLEAALLSRCLEQPRVEVDGKFLRAVRVAQDKNLTKQELIATYNWAWTTYYWFDDFKGFNRLYDEVERLALGTDSASEIERLTNLWPLLGTAVAAGKLTPQDAKLEARGPALTRSLERISSETSRPNNALYAKALHLFKWVTDRRHDGNEMLDDIWLEFRELLTQANGLGAFPLESIADVLTELGALVPESEVFDKLYEQMADIIAVRRSEGAGAQKNSERGFQKLKKEKSYEAIRWFGRAVGLLVKEEYRDELINALMGSSFAYEQAGLLWAARNYVLSAVSNQFALFRETGSITDVNPEILRRYFWLELRLGRVPQILSAYEIEMMVRGARAKTAEQRAVLFGEQTDHAAMLGALLLKTPFDQLPAIALFPDSLDRLGLFHARTTLLFLMGQVDSLREDGTIPTDETEEGILDYFDHWSVYADSLGLPHAPDYLLNKTVTLRSRIVGSDVTIRAANNLTSMGVGEALLGALECLLATSLSERFTPFLDRLEIRVVSSAAKVGPPTLEFVEESGVTVGVVSHPVPLTYRTRDEVLSFPFWLRDAVLEIFLQFTSPADPEGWVKKIISGEDAFGRAITFSNAPTMLEYLFGATLPSMMDRVEQGDTTYEMKRSRAWTPKERPMPQTHDTPNFGEGAPPVGLFDLESRKHSDYRVVSPIDVRKWNAAKWDATVFQWAPGAPELPPILGLAFINNVPAMGIFQGWLSRFGQLDENEELRVVIVRGISAANPHAYAVSVGPALEDSLSTAGQTIGLVSRIKRMNASSSKNLEGFLAHYRQQGRYLLTPFHFPTRESTPEPMMDFSIGKHRLVVRDAWEIGENDPDIMALDLDDPPHIPPDVSNPPILKALDRMATLERETW
jgi:hypothetical protein